ncbi:MAG: hypothetical protein ACI88A_000437 [Paraglaciecola sp.]|jgi:hypothetical protein
MPFLEALRALSKSLCITFSAKNSSKMRGV